VTRRLIAWLTLVVAALAVAGTLAVARHPTASTDQCALPLGERTGGWFCPSH
jgi:hypothetical protein